MNIKFLRFCCLCILAFSASAPAWAQQGNPAPSAAISSKQPAEPEAYLDGEIPEEYLIEAEQFLHYCETRPILTNYYNCDCMASSYLGVRLKNKNLNSSEILGLIDHECMDATEAAGMEYQRCLGNRPLVRTRMSLEDYCQCYANSYAKAFEHYKAPVSSKVIVELQAEAHLRCADPGLAERIYPNYREPKQPPLHPEPDKK